VLEHFGEELVYNIIPDLVTYGISELSVLGSYDEDAAATFFDAKGTTSDETLGFVVSMFTEKLQSVKVEYTKTQATPTSDTLCADVEVCPYQECRSTVVDANEYNDTVCSEPCNNRGECDGIGSCTCKPTCKTPDGNEVFEKNQSVCESRAGAKWADWTGKRCNRVKIIGCRDWEAVNWAESANSDPVPGSKEACRYNPCAKNDGQGGFRSPCQNDAVCEMTEQDKLLNTFSCKCSAKYTGKFCDDTVPRFTDPKTTVGRGAGLKGAKENLEAQFTVFPRDQFAEAREYQTRAEALADMERLSVQLHDIEAIVFIELEGKKWKVYFTPIAAGNGESRLTVSWDGAAFINETIKLVSAIGEASHQFSTASRLLEGDVIAGEQVFFEIVLKDEFEQTLTSGGDASKIKCAFNQTGESALPASQDVVAIEDIGGSYAVSYTPEKAGAYSLAVSIENSKGQTDVFLLPIAKVNVIPADTSADTSVVSGLASTIELSAGSTTNFKIVPYDKFGNRNTYGVEPAGAMFALRLGMAKVSIAEILDSQMAVEYLVSVVAGESG
jgi:hypothetical protein